MPGSMRRLALTLGLLAALALPAAAGASQLIARDAKDVTLRVCGVCHQPDRTASLRLTRDGWDELIGEMVKRGAKLTDAERAQVLDYLSTNFLGEAPHPINLNTAPAIDLEAVIGLGRTEAGTFIAWREKNGPCKTINDLKNIAGVSFAKLDAARDRAGCF